MCESKMRGRVFLLYSPVTTVASVWSTIGHQILFSCRTRSVNVVQDVKKCWYICSRFVVFYMKSQWPPLRRVLPLPASEQPSDKGLNHDRLAVHALDQNELKSVLSKIMPHLWPIVSGPLGRIIRAGVPLRRKGKSASEEMKACQKFAVLRLLPSQCY